ncbi:arginyltransferase [Lysobacter claricitrinus]|uniref:arginyltransferase n=1 Tax=Lysobacter claricitrinus TaxID=3367728 RepID=UPI0037DB6438
MGNTPAREGEDLRLFHTGLHDCGYWPDRQARDLVLDPRDPRLPDWYALALGWGFRRSGDIVYRPHCASCRACTPVRIPVAGFHRNRTQRKTLRRNADLVMRICPAERTEEHLDLYRAYLSTRHAGGGMDGHGAPEFDQFLVGRWSRTRFLEFRTSTPDHTLLAVAVTDMTPDALSAVYTFYDPAHADRGLGNYAILRQLQWAAEEGRAHLYLGYWIAGHRKMDYKQHFRPLEAFDGRQWLAFPDETP